MVMIISVALDDELDAAIAGGSCSAIVSEAIREYLDRRRIAAAAAWHASLDGDDAAALTEFGSPEVCRQPG